MYHVNIILKEHALTYSSRWWGRHTNPTLQLGKPRLTVQGRARLSWVLYVTLPVDRVFFTQQMVSKGYFPVVTSVLLSIRTRMKMLEAPFGVQRHWKTLPFTQQRQPQMPHVTTDIFSKLKNWNTFLTISHYFWLRDILRNAIGVQKCWNPRTHQWGLTFLELKLSQKNPRWIGSCSYEDQSN